MKISLLVAAGAASSALAFLLPQQPLRLDLALDKAKSRFADSASSVLSAISSILDQPISALPVEVKQAWLEVLLKFPESVANLNFASKPKKFAQKQTFDFHVADNDLPNYKLRVKATPKSLGVDSVKQYSGYIDVEDEDKHFFYWFFESRNDPKNDPIILWLNGGPGCSSMTGLMFELGPSNIAKNIKPVHNPYSWNNNASVIFLDQPINVGYSYSSKLVSNTVAAGKDVYAFLQLFFKQFPEYLALPFHIAGESYAGHYIPVFANEILSHPKRNFNLTSVMIGNGLTDPLTQYPLYEPMACGAGGADAVLEDEQCQAMQDLLPRCLLLIESCYESGLVWSCVPASIYCNNAQMGPYQKTGRNVYDIRTMCGGLDLCYEELGWIDEYFNLPEVMAALGAEVERYDGCNFDINRNFLLAGDWMKPYQKQVTSLLDLGVPVLIYAGDKDFICNWLGNEAWLNALPWLGHEQFLAAPVRDWRVHGKSAGTVRNHRHFTFLRVFEAGHMVPHDQPANSLDMVNRWISGDYKF